MRPAVFAAGLLVGVTATFAVRACREWLWTRMMRELDHACLGEGMS